MQDRVVRRTHVTTPSNFTQEKGMYPCYYCGEDFALSNEKVAHMNCVSQLPTISQDGV